jgi:hypothetical protein
MRLSPEYIWEKLMASVSSIAEVDRPVKFRLANAYISQLSRLEETPSMRLELPERLAEDLREVLRRLDEAYRPSNTTPVGDFDFGADEASEIIGKIVSVYDSVCRMMGPWEED